MQFGGREFAADFSSYVKQISLALINFALWAKLTLLPGQSVCVGLYTLQCFAECLLALMLSQRSIKRGSKGSRRWEVTHPLTPPKVQGREMSVWFQPQFYFQSPNYILKSFSPLIFFQSRKVLGGDLPEMKSLRRRLGFHLSFKNTASVTENSPWVKSRCQR